MYLLRISALRVGVMLFRSLDVDLGLSIKQANDRPDIVVRVFHLKKESLMNALTKDCIFGKVSAHVSTIEWQKRGPPYPHVLLWLASPLMPDKINAIISAEIPNKDTNPHLHDIVVTNMMHGPC